VGGARPEGKALNQLLKSNPAWTVEQMTSMVLARCIDCSLQKGIREQRRVLTRNHHVDVREFVVQDLQGFGLHVNSCPVRKPQRLEDKLATPSEAA
jgi:hypothetical protein